MINFADPKKLESLLQDMSIAIYIFQKQYLEDNLDDFGITWYAAMLHTQFRNSFTQIKAFLETHYQKKDKAYKHFLRLMKNPGSYGFGMTPIANLKKIEDWKEGKTDSQKEK